MSLYDDIEIPPSSSPPPTAKEVKHLTPVILKTEEKPPPLVPSNLSFLKAQLESKKAQVQFKLKPPSLGIPPQFNKPVESDGPPPAKKLSATPSLLKPRRVQPLKGDAISTFSIVPKAAKEDSVYLFNEIMIEDEYNPTAPTDYYTFKAKREVQLARERAAKEVAARLEREHAEEIAKRGMGAAIAPPTELIDSSPIEEEPPAYEEPIPKKNVVSNIMSRMGYQHGLGLGKNKQGISTALQMERVGGAIGKIVDKSKEFTDAALAGTPEELPPVNVTEMLKDATKVVLVTNMALESDVDNELQNEVTEEMSKYGQVTKVAIHLINGAPESEKVRIFVEFSNQAQAIKAVIDLNKRFFNGRAIRALFYDADQFAVGNYNG
ncbi:Splicing factor 45 [Aphelenchoides bicaudatus]|nr:Splicing factor 45 [Aphelenchoides bicaudatus]